MKKKEHIDYMETYCRCMNQINARFEIFDWNVSEFEETGLIYLGPAESACLQLRKCYEMVAFASMAGNLRKVEETWAAFEKEWNFKKIIRKLEKLNADFLPKPFWIKETEEDADFEFIFPKELQFTSQELISNHGKLNQVLHARNPFKERIDYKFMIKSLVQQKKHLENQLLCHIATIEHETEHLQVIMKNEKGLASVKRLVRK